MQVLRTPSDFKKLRTSLQGSIGFVPTMGALHQGHLALLHKARQENDLVVLSIYVNRTQFNDPKDFEKYPNTLEKDLKLAQDIGVDFVFCPEFDEMYPDHYEVKVIETSDSKLLCGKDRPGHFDGVLSVVMKLFNIVQPTRAYFGEKDFQQLTLIKKMVAAYFVPVQIIACPIVREADGLAMSSRNVRLSTQDREKAPLIYKILTTTNSPTEATAELTQAGFKVDYVSYMWNRKFVAVKVGPPENEVRLIDNVAY